MALLDLQRRIPRLERTQSMLIIGGVLVASASLGFLAAQQPLLAIVVPLGAGAAAVLFARPNVATLVGIFFLYSNLAAVAKKFHGVPFVIAAALPLVWFVPMTVRVVRRQQPFVFTPSMPAILFFLLLHLVGVLVAIDTQVAASELSIFFFEGVLIYVLVVNTVRTPRTLRLAIWSLLLAGILLGAVPLYQQLTGTFDNNYGGLAQTGGAFETGDINLFGGVRQPRLSGAIGEKNRYSQIMLMLVPLGLFQSTSEKSKWLRTLALIATILSAIGVVLAFSRGAAVGFVLLVILALMLRIIRPSHFFIVILLVAGLLIAFPQYRERLSSLTRLPVFLQNLTGQQTESANVDGAIVGRTTEMIAAVRIFADHPLIGVGPGMYILYSQEYANELGLRYLQEPRRAHSLILEVAANHGTLGLLAVGLILYETLRGLFRTREQLETYQNPILYSAASGLLLAVLAYLTTGIFLHFAYIRYFWLILGLSDASSRIALSLKPPHSAPGRDSAT